MAQSMALYRKWRPLTFDQVIGQDHITSALQSQVQQGRVSHAYIFTGTRGTGKTTCAKILARAVCCENPINGEPCNQCPSCLTILEDSTSDCSEIDAASYTGVDNIRAIREEALYTPTMLSRRIFIIDEVHMLSASAFNALLKIMEEPPAHVLFVLATTDIHKVPATILSRCQRFDFRRVSVSAIAERLLHIAEKEGYSLTPDAAEMIARLGDGSVRDSISLYDRCMPYNGTVDAKRVTESLGMPDSDGIARMYEYIVDRDGAGAMSVFLEMYSSGKDIISVFDSLLSLVRDIYVVKLTNKAEYLSVNSIDRVKALADKTEMSSLEFYVNCISELLQRLTRTAARRADGEVCLLKMSMGGAVAAPVVLTAPAASVKAAAPAAKPDPKPEVTPAQPVVERIAEPAPVDAPAQAPVAAPTQTVAPSSDTFKPTPKRTEQAADGLKQSFLNLVSTKVNPGVRTFIGMSDIKSSEQRLRIEAPDESLRILNKPEYIAIFKEAAAALGFSDVTVSKKVDVPPPLSPIDSILNKAQSMGIHVERK